MPYKNELSGAELSQTELDWLNNEVFGISEIEQGELRLNNGNLAELSFDKPNYGSVSEVKFD